MRKALILIAVVALASLGLAACGGDDNNDTGGAATAGGGASGGISTRGSTAQVDDSKAPVVFALMAPKLPSGLPA